MQLFPMEMKKKYLQDVAVFVPVNVQNATFAHLAKIININAITQRKS